MISRTLAITCMLGLLTSGCRTQTIAPLSVNTTQHSPVRMHVYDSPDPLYINKVLLLPPLGLENPDERDRLQKTLYSAAQRRFTVPINMISSDSAYAPYTDESNLICSDGTINLDEISIIGNLMNTVYVICPYVRELKPYHPQRIDIKILVIDASKNQLCAELSSVFDAQDNDTFDYFMEYSQSHKNKGESYDDLTFRIKSPAAFQAFVADMCSSVMAEKLPF